MKAYELEDLKSQRRLVHAGEFCYCPLFLIIKNVMIVRVERDGINIIGIHCRAPLHEECPKHHGHKEDPGVTPESCGAVGGRAQVILVWVRALGVGNASHPRRLAGTRVRP